MSIVIIGGNERMVYQYEDICRGYGCRAKVFAKESGALKKKLGWEGHISAVYKIGYRLEI